MQSKFDRRAGLRHAAGIFAICLLASSPAAATPLSDLLGGGSISAGGLTFTGWSAEDFSDVGLDLASIEVVALSSGPAGGPGFSLVTNTSTNGDIVELALAFSVLADPGVNVAGAQVELMGASVAGGSVLQLVADFGGVSLVATSVDPLQGVTLAPAGSFAVLASILIDDQGTLGSVDWRFLAVPEPTALLLIGSVALLWCSRGRHPTSGA